VTEEVRDSLTPAQSRAARALLGWNQRELAAKADIAISTVADFERGKRVPVPDSLDVIRTTLEANGISFLAGGAVMKNKRIRFTWAELEIINRMAAIASAAEWGEGDYQGWDENHSGPFNSLRRKVWGLISRADRQPNDLG
jgi:transcriptional regulator with XRE-family HTH domain